VSDEPLRSRRGPVDWLKLNKPDEPIPLDVVRKLAKHGGARTKGQKQADNVSLKRGSHSRAYHRRSYGRGIDRPSFESLSYAARKIFYGGEVHFQKWASIVGRAAIDLC
jgi:hypothetical protein